MGSVFNLVLSRDERVKRDGDSVLVPLRVPWYRSLPVSALEALNITVDGQTFTSDQLSLVMGGDEIPFAQLKDRSYDFWFVQDTAWARVPMTPAGDTVTIHIESALRIPYLMVRPDQAMVRHLSEDATRSVEGMN